MDIKFSKLQQRVLESPISPGIKKRPTEELHDELYEEVKRMLPGKEPPILNPQRFKLNIEEREGLKYSIEETIKSGETPEKIAEYIVMALESKLDDLKGEAEDAENSNNSGKQKFKSPIFRRST